MSTKPNKLTELQIRRIQGGELIKQGFDNDEIVEITHCSLSSAKRWRKQVELQGSESLLPKPRSGRGSKLSDSQKEKLETILLQGARHFGYLSDLWTCKRIAQVIRREFGVDYHPMSLPYLLRQIGFSPQKPIRRSRKYSAETVQTWWRYKWPLIKKVA